MNVYDSIVSVCLTNVNNIDIYIFLKFIFLIN